MDLVWIIAHKMLLELFRKRIPYIVGMVGLLFIVSLPFLLRSDGTLKGQLQLTFTYSISVLFMMLSLLTVFLATKSFTSEIKYKQYYLLDCKPVARWQFFLGKWLGLVVLNLLLLVVLGGTIFGLSLITISSQREQRLKEHMDAELLTAYRGLRPYSNLSQLDKIVSAEYERMKQEGRIPLDASENAVKQELEKVLQFREHLVPVGFQRKWIFKGIPATLRQNSEQYLKLRYKVFTAQTAYGAMCKFIWQVGRGEHGYSFQSKVKIGEFVEHTIPVEVIDDSNVVEIRFLHNDTSAGYVYFPVENGIELLYPAGKFFGNYCRGLLLIFITLCFMAVLALFTSTFLTFPVATLLSFYLILLGMLAEFFLDILPARTGGISYMLQFLFTFIPNFSHYDPSEYLSSGRMIEWRLVGESMVSLLLIRGSILAVAGCLIFHYREIGKPLED